MFSIDFVFHMYFLVRYCRLLEENSFRGRTEDFIIFIVFGMTIMMLIAPFVNIPFFGSSLTFMMVYLWGRRNEHIRMNFLGLLPFTAPYLPWVLLAFSLVLGNSATVDLIGIAVGHTYFYLDDIYPRVAELRGWNPRRILRLPVGDTIQIETEVLGQQLNRPEVVPVELEVNENELQTEQPNQEANIQEDTAQDIDDIPTEGLRQRIVNEEEET